MPIVLDTSPSLDVSPDGPYVTVGYGRPFLVADGYESPFPAPKEGSLMMDHGQLDQLAEEFFGAIIDGDLECLAELYDPAAEIWHNITQQTQSREGGLAVLEGFVRTSSGRRYEVEGREFFADGFVQRHTLRYIADSGDPVSVPVCIVVHAVEGRIRRIYEYMHMGRLMTLDGG